MVETAPEQLIADRLSQLPDVRRVYLFGSRARGDNAARADIDIAVEGPSDPRRWQQVEDAVDAMETLLRIDLVRLADAPSELRASILREGKLLYERG